MRLNKKYKNLYDSILELGWEEYDEDEDLDGNWVYSTEFHPLKEQEEDYEGSLAQELKEALWKAQQFDKLIKNNKKDLK